MIQTLLFLHVLLFVFSFALTAGLGILTDRIAQGGDARVIHAAFTASRPLSMAGGFGWIVTALLGVALAIAEEQDLTASWLLGAYAAFAVLILVGFLMHAPWQARVIAASAAPGPELTALLRAPAHRIALMLSAVSVLVLLLLMVAGPG